MSDWICQTHGLINAVEPFIKTACKKCYDDLEAENERLRTELKTAQEQYLTSLKGLRMRFHHLIDRYTE